ncbi:MAG: iron-containing alcohol dehydrogenase [Thermodesulfobacteriaceae bacterium]|nr:iron-containing alcohol dehydrogenase [Thermodesulfobacteriaceae bacterium]
MKNFVWQIPTKILFGKDILATLPRETLNYGQGILFLYGRDSIKKTGLYEKIKALFKETEGKLIELGGIKPSPTLEQVLEGINLAQKEKIEVILAVGGGSVIDAGKAIACGVFYKEGFWELFEKRKSPEKALPLIAIPTVSGTGSELNEVCVITNEEKKLKLSLRGRVLYPKVAFLDPTLTFSVPKNYTAYASFDAFSHVLETFLHREHKEEGLTEDFMVVLMKNLIKWSKLAIKEPENFKARANLMWASSLALCGLIRAGIGVCRFKIHALEHTLSGVFGIPHGLGLAILSQAWLKKYSQTPMVKKFFEKVFKTKDSEKGLSLFISWLKELGIPLSLKELAIKKEDLKFLTNQAYFIYELYGAHREISKEEIEEIFEMAYE